MTVLALASAYLRFLKSAPQFQALALYFSRL